MSVSASYVPQPAERCSYLRLWDYKNALSKCDPEAQSLLELLPQEKQKRITDFVENYLAQNPTITKAQAVDQFVKTRVYEKYDKEGKAAQAELDLEKEGKLGFEAASSVCEGLSSDRSSSSSSSFSETGKEVPFTQEKMEPSHIGQARLQGRRPMMEDRSFFNTIPLKCAEGETEALVVGVCDGHGDGGAAAIFVAEKFAPYLQTAVKKHGLSKEGLFAACKETFTQLSADYQSSEAYLVRGGTTVCVAIMVNGEVVVCNSGDSRAILVPNNPLAPLVPLSEDHKASNERLSKAVVKRGGFIFEGAGGIRRVNGNLAVLRSVGDLDIKGDTDRICIVQTPKLITTKGEGFLLLATDGLWDVATRKQVADFIRNNSQLEPQGIVAALANKAYNNGSKDNICVVGLRIGVPREPSAV